ncbi:hypothetical protein BDN67DRAFT_985775 [Paxillus ammoniavirescens]|nr:hypothetical protein BDN67DRAFT_985775 [Paxillus ammoniavirescens]
MAHSKQTARKVAGGTAPGVTIPILHACSPFTEEGCSTPLEPITQRLRSASLAPVLEENRHKILEKVTLNPSDLELVRGTEVLFHCLSCHWQLDKKAGEPSPYFGFYRQGQPVLQTFLKIHGRFELSTRAHIRSALTILLHLCLEGITAGGPMEMLRQFLLPYFPHGGLTCVELEFDLATATKKRRYLTKALKIALELSEHGFSDVLVMLNNHTDEVTGDFFLSHLRGSAVPMEVSPFMDTLLDPFRQILPGAILLLTACGSVVNKSDSFQALQGAVAQ